MRAVDVIQKKRDGAELSRDEIEFFIRGYARGDVPDYQASAFTMAVFFRGMTPGETVALTEAMMRTGEVLDLSEMPGAKVDKHSTGGVGDKTSLVLAPLAAACGVFVPMISGRGLGHTGGTLDKLDSIPGYVSQPDVALFRRVGPDVGSVVFRDAVIALLGGPVPLLATLPERGVGFVKRVRGDSRITVIHMSRESRPAMVAELLRILARAGIGGGRSTAPAGDQTS